MMQARFDLTDFVASRLTVGSQVRWQHVAQLEYSGGGLNSRKCMGRAALCLMPAIFAVYIPTCAPQVRPKSA
jgi:hypothetical protein